MGKLTYREDHPARRRAGLDYWPQVDLNIWADFDAFLTALTPADHEMHLFTKNGSQPFWDMQPLERMFLIFGAETMGLPPAILNRYPHADFCIPMTGAIRSLNLSTAAGIALYEALRRRTAGSRTRPI